MTVNRSADRIGCCTFRYGTGCCTFRCGSRFNTNLQQVGALPWSQTTDVLDQALSVRMGDGLVHVHSNLIDTVDKFTVKRTEQIFLHHMLLRTKVRNTHKLQSQVLIIIADDVQEFEEAVRLNTSMRDYDQTCSKTM